MFKITIRDVGSFVITEEEADSVRVRLFNPIPHDGAVDVIEIERLGLFFNRDAFSVLCPVDAWNNEL